METTEAALRVVMAVSTGALFLYGLFKGYDTLELFTYNLYFITLILYLIKQYLFSTFEIPAVQLVGATPPNGASPPVALRS